MNFDVCTNLFLVTRKTLQYHMAHEAMGHGTCRVAPSFFSLVGSLFILCVEINICWPQRLLFARPNAARCHLVCLCVCVHYQLSLSAYFIDFDSYLVL